MASIKANAWDAVGLDFWRRGRISAKPSRGSIRWFLSGIKSGHHCVIVGGTSVGLIRSALRSGADVTVVDFSERVCAELLQYASSPLNVVCADVLALGQEFRPPPTHILSDTLINRMDNDEATSFAASSARLLPPGGIFRATVFLGPYEMDRRLLQLARDSGQPTEIFWDQATSTIDFGKVPADLLERGLVPHGGISRARLLAWYRQRGREKRFTEPDLRKLFTSPAWDWVVLAADEDPKRARIELVRI